MAAGLLSVGMGLLCWYAGVLQFEEERFGLVVLDGFLGILCVVLGVWYEVWLL